ncbi:uncharacterized protein LOC131288000 [Anopheles ziemanni]|uniref:uncharacterized protein LOC131259376 n=1 Tax=Anopheles coustani TaxID=139045 RepID=UPI002659E411|nr:uncharacterized protein LOC131259376 [Anopheles coustani]XP_058173078.1 uncharacterized protein LOC131288000 [Anopheles ziemanni]
MSTAYKHLYSCVTFLIFIFVVNFYKNRIGVSREREASFRASSSKFKRTGALNRPLPLGEPGEDFFFGFPTFDGPSKYPSGDEGTIGVWDRLKQYPGRCLDVEVFFIPPSTPGGRPRSGPDPEGLHYKTLQAARRKDQLVHPEETNSSVYVFLSVLVILLLAAGVDIVKHLTAVRTPQEHTQRRLSLQNYQALIREKQKQFRMMKQHYSQPSMSIQRSMDEQAFPPQFPRAAEEPPSMGLPAPLLRRQSVPALMRTQPGLGQAGPAPAGIVMGGRNGGPSPFGRRTSVDSFWDTDAHMTKASMPSGGLGNGSSPEVRRRVRMLHRH